MGAHYSSGYLKDNILAAVDEVIDLVTKHGINGHAAALRWVVYHSQLRFDLGDAVLIAASSVAQLESNFGFIKAGPLPAELVDAINNVYGKVAGSEFPYHF
jgi:aflatoxin B1 aldehyde reductase